MKKIAAVAAAIAGLAGVAGTATAGGIERSFSPYAILWEKGNYLEFSFGRVAPKVSGSSTFPAPPPKFSGDMTGDYTQFGLGIKYALTDRLDLALVIDEPIGADINYPAGTGYALGGAVASVDSNAISLLARYRFDGGFSVHGGVKAQRTKGNVALPFMGYSLRTSTETDVGYLLGVAYERPDIALRVALTWQSAITHDFDGQEVTAFGPLSSRFSIEVPEQISLDFQTGIAPDTLLFGSVRWRDWSSFRIEPQGYMGYGVGALVDYPKDVVTWTLGLGRRFNENWSGAISVGYEKGHGQRTGNLGPHDGMRSLTVGGTYTKDNMKVTAGVSYIKVGDATTNLPVSGRFTDNKAIGFGVKVGFSF